jgi:hypothetical protein
VLLYLLELIFFDLDEDDEDDDFEPGEVNDDKDEEVDDEEEFADSTPLFLSFLLILFKLKIGVTGEYVD